MYIFMSRFTTQRGVKSAEKEQVLLLVLRDAEAADSAVLTCQATNAHGSRSAGFTLRVLGMSSTSRCIFRLTCSLRPSHL
jgi:hypothetical protein